MPQNRDHAGELLPNGFHVGDYVTYTRPSGAHYERSGYVTYNMEPDAVWATFDDNTSDSLARFERGELGSYLRPVSRATLLRRHDGSAPSDTTTEGSTTMTEAVEFWFHGEPLTNSMRATEIVEGQEYRLIYPRDHHNFELTGRARHSYTPSRGRSMSFEITGWPRPQGSTWSEASHPVGSTWRVDWDVQPGDYSYSFFIPVGVHGTVPSAEIQEEAHNGVKGAFLPHSGEMPEVSAIVRGMVAGTNRQVEGLFLRGDGESLVVERKRKRAKKADGTFGDWEAYANVGRVTLTAEGAEVFKAGASKPAEAVWTRMRGITSSSPDARAEVGQIISAPSYATMHENRIAIYRGEVTNSHGYSGEYTIRATEKATVNRRDAVGVYDFKPIPEEEIMVYATFSEARNGLARGAYLWEKLAPGQKPVDPAFDPKRKTSYTGLGIGDLVVGLMHGGGRDTVSSWVKGEIFKWDVRNNRPIVKVTDKMESTKKVGDEATLHSDDVYPAMADPSAVSPEEYKKTLRLYLIGRHKRGDFCRGGLNTMLAAHGIPLYETRRRAQLLVTVDYDPNETDLYTVQSALSRQLAHVSGLSFSERSGEDIELTLESDTTQG
jgi:hypothetical protein